MMKEAERGTGRAYELRAMRKARRGFTVVELMFVVAVLGVLSAVAILKFNGYVMDSKRTEAYFGLASVRGAERLYYLNENRYTDRFSNLAFSIVKGQQVGTTQYFGGRYTYSLSQPDGPSSFRCVATADLDGDPWPDVLVTYDLQE